MRRKLGISIYPDHSDPARDREYLDLAARHGFSRIFMSMLELVGGRDVAMARFRDIISFAHERGFEVILDVNPAIFDELGVSYDDLGLFHELGADGIRLDTGFDGRRESFLTFNPYGLAIELNMSSDVAYLDNILTYQANRPYLYGCHNFYPQDGTGLPYDFFECCSRRFKQQGLRTAAFVSCKDGALGPWPVNDGLPTLEMHRHLPADVAAKHLFATGLIDDVIVGNAYATEAELEALGRVDRYQTCFAVDLLPGASELERTIVTGEQHERRGDICERVMRSTEVRVKYREQANPPHDNELEFQPGDVVVGNDGFGNYKNELQVVLEPHRDVRKNLVGRIRPEELVLLPFVRPWSKFRFEER